MQSSRCRLADHFVAGAKHLIDHRDAGSVARPLRARARDAKTAAVVANLEAGRTSPLGRFALTLNLYAAAPAALAQIAAPMLDRATSHCAL
jgi:hypothetical protein